MNYDRLVIGYHGCTRSAADAILQTGNFRKSKNDYDWLGHGIYFWEFGPDRALRFMEEKLRREGRDEEPAAVGALLQLGTCFDLLDTRFTADLGEAFPAFKRSLEEQGHALPKNAGSTPDRLLRRLDCAVLNWYLELVEQRGVEYQTVRGCFIEGEPAYPGSGLHRETHIQLAVRDPDCIIGVFAPKV